ncbi:hypothetical protein EYF80_033956 [Liparis tanakae]|uniref:Uncharacterized protein n=1 Tax=Liparis tanakae TaxID=230148 RepID=A0A4Z2GT55_9TELE|nr:hypothetical protein EYF80_033956 [Liparis tanakae]
MNRNWREALDSNRLVTLVQRSLKEGKEFFTFEHDVFSWRRLLERRGDTACSSIRLVSKPSSGRRTCCWGGPVRSASAPRSILLMWSSCRSSFTQRDSAAARWVINTGERRDTVSYEEQRRVCDASLPAVCRLRFTCPFSNSNILIFSWRFLKADNISTRKTRHADRGD